MDAREAAEALSDGINCLVELSGLATTTELDASWLRVLERFGDALDRVESGEFETTLVVSQALKNAVVRLKRILGPDGGDGKESLDELSRIARLALSELGGTGDV